MLNATAAMTLYTAMDVLRRGSTWILAVVGVALILTLRWFSAFGLGYEVNQLKELGVYTVGLLGAVGVLLFCLPREDEPEGGEDLYRTRPISPWVIALGGFFGRLLPIVALTVLWTAAIGAALWWFELEDPRLFQYQGAQSAGAETATLLLPVCGQVLASAILLAFVVPLSRFRRPVMIAFGAMLVYVAGYAAAAVGGAWAVLLPDLARLDLTPMLWGTPSEIAVPALVLHACAWCAIGIALDGLSMSVRSVA